MKTILISIPQQCLQLLQDNQIVLNFPVSTAKKGAGEINGSEQTPRGWHVIRAKVGENCQSGTVFVGRRPTGEIFNSALKKQHPDRDWILTRILWLSGLEPGFNRMGRVDTMRRYIYIHGCPEEDELGQPGSHGCIKMRNEDVILLFQQIDVGTKVLIAEK
jgi:L,D-transpeptidase YbiS